MKKIITISAAVLAMGAMSLSAQKTAEQLRVYINPGHGAWTANDRPMNTMREVDGKIVVFDPKSGQNLPDTTCFFETNTNIRKALAVVDKLESYGLKIDRTKNQTNSNKYRVGAALDLHNNICMSHTKGGPAPKDEINPNTGTTYPSQSRGLTEISYEAQSNNFDMFMSIHSNAHTADAGLNNYLVFFYRGTNDENGDRNPGSAEMCKLAWNHAFSVKHHHWVNRLSNDIGQGVLGDVTFMHGDYYSETTGVWGYYGALRHTVPGYLVEGYFHTYQPSRARAMNFDACRLEGYMYARGVADYFGLEKESTGDIYGIVRDKRVRFTHDMYHATSKTTDEFKPINNCTVILTKDGKEVRRTVTDKHYNGGFVFMDLEPGEYTLHFEHPDYFDADEEEVVTYTVEPAKSVFPEVFLCNSHYTPPEGDFYDYPDPATDYAEVTAPESLTFSDEVNTSTIAELAGQNVKRTLLMGNYMYVLAYNAQDAASIVVYDVKSKEVYRKLSLAGIEAVGDIVVTNDGILIAVNAATQERGKASAVFCYKWEKDDNGVATGDPVEWVRMDSSAEYAEAMTGKTAAFSGTSGDGHLVFSCITTASAKGVRLELLNFVDGYWSDDIYINMERMKAHGKTMSDTNLGDFQVSISPFNENALVITSENLPPFEFSYKLENGKVSTLVAEFPADMLDGTGFRSTFFKVGGKIMMAAPVKDGFQVFDVTEGLAKPTLISNTASTKAKAPAWNQAPAGTPSVNGRAEVEVDEAGAYKSHSVKLYTVSGDVVVSEFVAAASGVENVSIDNVNNGKVEYYNLQGQRISNPGEGQIVIRRQGNDAKVVIK